MESGVGEKDGDYGRSLDAIDGGNKGLQIESDGI